MNRIFVLMVVLLMCSCSSKEHNNNMDIEVFDIESSSSDLDIITQIDSISYVILDDSFEESVFSEISKCQIFNGCIYILDFEKTKTVTVFDINGKYLHTLGKKGNGPGEFVCVFDFDVNESGIYMLDRNLKKIMHYSLMGKFLEEFSYLNKRYMVNGLAVTDDKKFVLGMDKERGEGSPKLLLSSQDFRELEYLDTFCEFDTRGELKLDAVKHNGDKIIFHYPVSDIVHILDTSGKIKKTMKISLGGKTIPDNMRKSFEKLEDNSQDYIYFYDTPFITDRYLLSVLSYHSRQALLLWDLRLNKYFLNEYTDGEMYDINKMLFPVFANDDIIVCYLNQYLYDRTKNVVLSEKQCKYLEEGGTLLVVYYLKK